MAEDGKPQGPQPGSDADAAAKKRQLDVEIEDLEVEDSSEIVGGGCCIWSVEKPE